MKKVEVTIDIRVKPEKIISAFTEAKMLRDWWGVEQSLVETKSGGLYTLAWNVTDKGFGYVSTGIIAEYQRDQKLVVEKLVYLNPERSVLGPMKLIVEATEKNEGSELYLCQDGYRDGGDWDWYYEAVHQAWPVVVKVLKKYLEENAR